MASARFTGKTIQEPAPPADSPYVDAHFDPWIRGSARALRAHGAARARTRPERVRPRGHDGRRAPGDPRPRWRALVPARLRATAREVRVVRRAGRHELERRPPRVELPSVERPDAGRLPHRVLAAGGIRRRHADD